MMMSLSSDNLYSSRDKNNTRIERGENKDKEEYKQQGHQKIPSLSLLCALILLPILVLIIRM